MVAPSNRKLWMLVASLVTLVVMALIARWANALDADAVRYLGNCATWALGLAVGGNAVEHGAPHAPAVVSAARQQAGGGTP